jgi:hypothetical protein
MTVEGSLYDKGLKFLYKSSTYVSVQPTFKLRPKCAQTTTVGASFASKGGHQRLALVQELTGMGREL